MKFDAQTLADHKQPQPPTYSPRLTQPTQQWRTTEIGPGLFVAASEISVNPLVQLKLSIIPKSEGYSCYINDKQVEWFAVASIGEAQILFMREVINMVGQLLGQARSLLQQTA
jgi:hypothetical protein